MITDIYAVVSLDQRPVCPVILIGVSQDNSDVLSFRGLLTKNNGQILSDDFRFEKTGDGYTVYADIRNNSLQSQYIGTPMVALVDSEGNELARKDLKFAKQTLDGEAQISSVPVNFTADEVNGTPALAVRAVMTYFDNDTENSVDQFKILTSSDTELKDYWYVAMDNVTISERIVINGDAHLILMDGAQLTAEKGVELTDGNSLSVYGQTESSGILTANGAYAYFSTGSYFAKAIGGRDSQIYSSIFKCKR